MPHPLLPPLTLAAALLLLAGCAPEQRQYQVSVENHTDIPLTIGLVKNGPLFESSWAAPEDYAVDKPGAKDIHWGHLVAPGAAGTITLKGQFEPHVKAVLRIYEGDRPFYELLAMSGDDTNRLSILLRQETESVAVGEHDGHLTFKFVKPESPPPTP